MVTVYMGFMPRCLLTKYYIEAMINERIVDVAINNLNNRHVRGNLGYEKEGVSNRVERYGCDVGEAWAVYFCELVWSFSYGHGNRDIRARLGYIFDGDANTVLMKVMEKSERYRYVFSSVPRDGSIAVFKRSGGTGGHMAIVIGHNASTFFAIGGRVKGTLSDKWFYPGN